MKCPRLLRKAVIINELKHLSLCIWWQLREKSPILGLSGKYSTKRARSSGIRPDLSTSVVVAVVRRRVSQNEAVGTCTGEACPSCRSLLRPVASHCRVGSSTSPLLQAGTPEEVCVLESTSRCPTVSTASPLASDHSTSWLDVAGSLLLVSMHQSPVPIWNQVAKVRSSMADADQSTFFWPPSTLCCQF